MDWEPGAHATTFGGNLLACAAAMAGLDVLQKQRLADNAARLGKIALRRLQEMAGSYELIGDVRGKGLVLAVEFVKDRETKKPAVEERNKVVQAALNRGVLVFRGGQSAIRLAPPLIISQRELELGLDLFEQGLKEVQEKC
jgi:4-aminobutyrate aminotransferase